MGVNLLGDSQEFQAIHAGHFDVGQQEIETFFLEQPRGSLAIGDACHRVTVPLQNAGTGVDYSLFVVYNQNSSASHVG
jgi:hypothetical protein